MISKKILSPILIVLLLTSCSTSNQMTFWVNGTKSETSAGAGKMESLNIYRGNDIDNPKWENFYSRIEGFEFEEGYLKKIRVKVDKKDHVPADASSLKYTLVREIEKKMDNLAYINDSWTLNSINGNSIDKKVKLPEININVKNSLVSGMGGCNNYSGKIEIINQSILRFGNIVSTRKACINQNIETEYFRALNAVETYKIVGKELILCDYKGETLLTFFKKNDNTSNTRLNDIWNVTHIMGVPVNGINGKPRLEINLTRMKIYGSDSCNQFNGQIKEFSKSRIVLGSLFSTRKLCPQMEIADNFNKALSKVSSYKLKDLNLLLFDSAGNEVLTLKKAD